MKLLICLTVTVFTATNAALAQVSPYSSYQEREIKALSTEEIVAYLNGDGMGYALAAELNAYPGPKHVLELADSIGLDDRQRAASLRVADVMRSTATQLGARIVALERTLDSLFADRVVSADRLRTTLDELGHLQGELRYAHLAAHLEMADILTEHQIRVYQRMRGYGSGDGGHRHRSGS